MAYVSKNPYTGEVSQTFPDATDVEVEKAITDAHAAFQSWKETSFAQRAEVMKRAAGLLRKDIESHATFLTVEMGKLFSTPPTFPNAQPPSRP